MEDRAVRNIVRLVLLNRVLWRLGLKSLWALLLFVPVALVLLVLGIPVVAVLAVAAAPVVIALALIGLPVILLLGAVGIVLGLLGAALALGVLLLKLALFVVLPVAVVIWLVRWLWDGGGAEKGRGAV